MIIPILLLIILNLQSLEIMDQTYNHAFLKFENPYDVIRDFRAKQLTNFPLHYPHVEVGEYRFIMKWAAEEGVYKHRELVVHKPAIELLNIYYSNPSLENKFPEVKNDHDLSNLIQWALNQDLSENKTLRDAQGYLVRYYNSLEVPPQPTPTPTPEPTAVQTLLQGICFQVMD